jgi:predicted permease
MSWLARWRELGRGLFHRRREEQELEEEMRFHVEMETEANVARGMGAAEAARAARLAFGMRERHKEDVRAARGTAWIEDLGADLRHGLRLARRSPGFAAVVILTLGIGIGANAAVFSVVDGVLLRPLPFAEPERLVLVRGGMSVTGEYLAVREEVRSFDGVAAFNAFNQVSLTGEGDPVRLSAAMISPELFPLLGIAPVLGRHFAPEEAVRGSESVAILSHSLWQQRFGGDPGVLGRRVRLDSEERTVVGVMPAGTRFPSHDVQVWLPLATAGIPATEMWGAGGHFIVARLAPGVSQQTATAEILGLAPRLRERVPWQMPPDYWRGIDIAPLQQAMVGDVRSILLVLLGAVGLVLLIVCVNIANLFLARSAARTGEIAVRTTLGAGRGRLVRQLLTEGLVLTLLGGVLGVILALLGSRALLLLLPAELPRAAEVVVDGRVLLFTLVISLGAALLFGLAPALRASNPDLQGTLREGHRAGTGPARQRLAAGLVASQIALAVVLVVGAGLLVRSLDRLLLVDPGFRADRVLTAAVDPPGFRYTTPVSELEFYETLIERLAALPGAAGAAVASGLPFAGDAYGSVFVVEGQPDPATQGGDWPFADGRLTVSNDYFRVLGVPLQAGRSFGTEESASGARSVVVSRSLADRYWPGTDPLGARIRFPGDQEWRTVIGVVGDVRWGDLTGEPGGGLYIPLQQGWGGPMRILLATASSFDAAAAALRSTVSNLDPDAPVSEVRPMTQLVAASAGETRAATLLLSIFAGIALLLGAVGIYGVTSYAVTQRLREYGIRMALGARGRDVRGLVLRKGMLLSLAGTVPGLLLAAAGARALSGLLYGVSATDPLTFLAVPLLLTAIALLAAYLPAHRAARVDPMSAIRTS